MQKMNYWLLLLCFFMYIGSAVAGDTPNRIIVNADMGKEQISKHIYGHFAEHLGNCIYGGFWVGENSPIPNTRGFRNDVLNAMREIKPPVIRWPGGCFADTYHWKDGIGPRENRPSIINTNWGGVTEDNSFGTHEFLDLCELLETEPYICVNVGSGTVQEAAEWVEYVNSNAVSPMTELRKKNGREKPWNVKYWAVGNESWGCGGNMTPEFYADQFKRFATYMNTGRLYRVAGGGTDADFDWTRTVMQKTQAYPNLIQGYSFHYYSFCHGWNDKSAATQFTENDWFSTMKVTWLVDERLRQHSRVMDEFDPNNRIGLIADEWGNWFTVEPGTNPGFLYQQNTVRDAVTAALYLNIFNNQCRRVKMANIAQTINVLQAMLLTKGDQIVKTPTFYVFKMYQVHQDATMLPLNMQCEDYQFENDKVPAVSASASRDAQGKVHISLANIDPNQDKEIAIDIRGAANYTKSSGEVITAPTMNAYNDFGKPEQVNIKSFNDFKIKDNSIVIKLPSKSVVTLELSN